MKTIIHIVKTPDGEGYQNNAYPVPNCRSAFVGCRFPLAAPCLVQKIEAEFFRDLSAPVAPAYSVVFDDALTGLRAASRYDLVDYLLGLSYHPRLLRFPKSCAELIRA